MVSLNIFFLLHLLFLSFLFLACHLPPPLFTSPAPDVVMDESLHDVPGVPVLDVHAPGALPHHNLVQNDGKGVDVSLLRTRTVKWLIDASISPFFFFILLYISTLLTECAFIVFTSQFQLLPYLNSSTLDSILCAMWYMYVCMHELEELIHNIDP